MKDTFLKICDSDQGEFLPDFREANLTTWDDFNEVNSERKEEYEAALMIPSCLNDQNALQLFFLDLAVSADFFERHTIL